ncbi:prolyl oligopeptidase family serine peptidase [Tissierella pigra]|uniref:Prolyl oligopeptidase family serine peptidase n=1 Tax=Tissierella pigra TaxID=2607614 RepID=A0A6N7XRN5_9FIRM|nr:alpha/beta fold hydrolase [Tissierella pigra]MBU5427667.1 prolyl oligopeptidase family serine peptidase [Tissierella pigra]MSU00417.1 prolyl oligopeptidase family serine peptidase [Tissierella pigra]
MELSKKNKFKRIIIAIVIVAIILLLIFLSVIPHFIMRPILGKRVERPQYKSSDYGIEAEHISLKTEDGLSLAAWHTKANNTKGTVIILSGIENPSVTAFFGYAKMFADNGWDSLLIEMRGRNLSEGKEIGLGYTEWNDVVAGVNYLSSNQEVSDLPIIAMGTSMGGATSIMAAGKDSRIDGVIAVSAFSSWEDVFSDNMNLMDAPKLFCTLEKPFVRLYSGIHYGFNITNYSPLKALKNFDNRPLLLMHSTKDSQVPYPSFQRLQKQAEKYNIDTSTFVREGDEHFICYEEYFNNPLQDTEFSNSILDFLNNNY